MIYDSDQDRRLCIYGLQTAKCLCECIANVEPRFGVLCSSMLKQFHGSKLTG